MDIRWLADNRRSVQHHAACVLASGKRMNIKDRFQEFVNRHPLARWGIPGLLLWVVFQIAWELIKDAVFGWVNEKLAGEFDMITTPIQEAWPILLGYGPPTFLAIAGVAISWGAYRIGVVTGQADLTNKLELAELTLTADDGADKGFLDYIVDGEQAIKDISRSLVKIAKETQKIGKKANRYTFVLRFVQSFKWRRKLIGRFSRHMSRYADRLFNYSKLIGRINPLIRTNCHSLMSVSDVTTGQQKEDLRGFIESMNNTAGAANRAIIVLKDYRKSVTSLRGVSGDLNAASTKLSTSIGSLIGKLKNYKNVCAELVSSGKAKLEVK